jgi:membrane-associated phospholipid phosphatase
MPTKEEADPTILLTIGLLSLIASIIAMIYLWDRPLEAVLHAQSSASLLDVAECISVLGLPLPYVSIAMAILIFWSIILVSSGFTIVERIFPYRALFILSGAIVPWLAANGLQAIFGRSRPHLYFERGIYAFHPFSLKPDFSSFPSSHSAVSAAMAAVFSILLPSYRVTFFLVATLVAASRVAAGYHYLSDTVGGMLVGITVVAGLLHGFDHFGMSVQSARPRRP